MGASDIILALLFGALGSALLAYLLFVLLKPVLKWSDGQKGKARLQRGANLIVLADQKIADKNFLDALIFLEQAPVFELPKSRALINSLREHHQNILSRCLIVAEENEARLSNLAEIERLFVQRAELQSLYLKAQEKFASVAQKRDSAGKSFPAWSKADFQKKITEIKSELQTNQKTLEAELRKLFAAIRSPVTDTITYH